VAASSPTDNDFLASPSKTRRRVGSASAANPANGERGWLVITYGKQ